MKISIAILFSAMIAMGLASCKNTDIPAPSFSASLDVVNASAQTVNFYLNGTRLNNGSNLYMGNNSGYLGVSMPGALVSQNFQFKLAGTPTVIANIALKLDTDSHNSVFLTTPEGKQGFSVVDDFSADTIITVAYVRFVNASTDVGSLDVNVGDSVSFKGIAYGKASPFTKISIGAKAVTVLQAGTSNLIVKGTSAALVADTKYTFFAMGSINGTGTSGFLVTSMLNQ